MEINKKYLTLSIIITIILIAFLLQPTTTTNITQNITYDDLTITKTIFLQQQKLEQYEIKLTDPIVGYLIIPKELANNTNEIILDGDFTFEIIEEDPIIKITSKEYSPGNKQLTIQYDKNNEYNSILLLIPLIEYNQLTELEKEELNQTIKQFSNLTKENYTIEESKKIMQEFANGLVETAEFKKKTNLSIHFAESNYFTKFNNNLKQIIQTRTIKNQPPQNESPPIQNNTLLARIQNTTDNIIQTRSISISDQNKDNQTHTTITLKNTTANQIPKDINLYISNDFPYSTKTIIFKTPYPNEGLNPKIIYPKNEIDLENYKPLNEIFIINQLNVNLETKNELELKLNIDLNLEQSQLPLEKITTKIIVDYGTLKPQDIVKINIVNDKCAQILDDLKHRINLNEKEKTDFLLKCNLDELKTTNQQVLNLGTKQLNQINDLIKETITKTLNTNTSLYTENQYNLLRVLVDDKLYIADWKESWEMRDRDYTQMQLFGQLSNFTCNTNPKLNLLIPENNNDLEESKAAKQIVPKTQIELNANDYRTTLCEIFEFKKQQQKIKNKLYNLLKTNQNSELIFETTEELLSLKETNIELLKINLANKSQEIFFHQKILYNPTPMLANPNEQKLVKNNEDRRIYFKTIEQLTIEMNTLVENLEKNQKNLLDAHDNNVYNLTNYQTEYFQKRKNLIGQQIQFESNPIIEEHIRLIYFEQELLNHILKNTDLNEDEKELIEKENKEFINKKIEESILTQFINETENEYLLINLFTTGATNEITKVLGISQQETGWKNTTLSTIQYITKPYYWGYFLYPKSFTDKLENQEDKQTYLMNLIEKKNNYEMLIALTKQLKTNEQLIDIEKYATTTQSKKALDELIYIKYKTLQEKLTFKLNKDSATKYQELEADFDYKKALQTGTQGLYPLARLQLESLIDSIKNETNSNIKNTFNQATQSFKLMQPKLTLFERALAKMKSPTQDPIQKELQRQYIDYRTDQDVWNTRMGSFTDLKYYIAFHTGINIGKVLLKPVIPTIKMFLPTTQTFIYAGKAVGQTTVGKITASTAKTFIKTTNLDKVAKGIFIAAKYTAKTLRTPFSKIRVLEEKHAINFIYKHPNLEPLIKTLTSHPHAYTKWIGAKISGTITKNQTSSLYNYINQYNLIKETSGLINVTNLVDGELAKTLARETGVYKTTKTTANTGTKIIDGFTTTPKTREILLGAGRFTDSSGREFLIAQIDDTIKVFLIKKQSSTTIINIASQTQHPATEILILATRTTPTQMTLPQAISNLRTEGIITTKYGLVAMHYANGAGVALVPIINADTSAVATMANTLPNVETLLSTQTKPIIINTSLSSVNRDTPLPRHPKGINFKEIESIKIETNLDSIPSPKTPEELAKEFVYAKDSFLFETNNLGQKLLPVKGSVVNQEKFVNDLIRTFKDNPYLAETFNGAEVFHGTQSETLFSMFQTNGLKPMGKLEELGITPFIGTQDIGAAIGVNKHSISTVIIDSYKKATFYAGDREIQITLKKLEDSLTKLKQYLSTLENKNSIAYFETTHNIEVLKMRIARFNSLTEVEKEQLTTQYPVLFGIKSSRPQAYTLANSDVYHEIALLDGTNLNEIRVVYVPENRITEVKNLLSIDPRTQHILVGDLEKLTGNKIELINTKPVLDSQANTKLFSKILTFFCSSPCKWISKEGIVVINTTDASIAIFDNEIIEITGNFEKGFIQGIKTVSYSPTAIVTKGENALPRELFANGPETINAVQSAMIDGKQIALISMEGTTQKITFYTNQDRLGDFLKADPENTSNLANLNEVETMVIEKEITLDQIQKVQEENILNASEASPEEWLENGFLPEVQKDGITKYRQFSEDAKIPEHWRDAKNLIGEPLEQLLKSGERYIIKKINGTNIVFELYPGAVSNETIAANGWNICDTAVNLENTDDQISLSFANKNQRYIPASLEKVRSQINALKRVTKSASNALSQGDVFVHGTDILSVFKMLESKNLLSSDALGGQVSREASKPNTLVVFNSRGVQSKLSNQIFLSRDIDFSARYAAFAADQYKQNQAMVILNNRFLVRPNIIGIKDREFVNLKGNGQYSAAGKSLTNNIIYPTVDPNFVQNAVGVMAERKLSAQYIEFILVPDTSYNSVMANIDKLIKQGKLSKTFMNTGKKYSDVIIPSKKTGNYTNWADGLDYALKKHGVFKSTFNIPLTKTAQTVFGLLNNPTMQKLGVVDIKLTGGTARATLLGNNVELPKSDLDLIIYMKDYSKLTDNKRQQIEYTIAKAFGVEKSAEFASGHLIDVQYGSEASGIMELLPGASINKISIDRWYQVHDPYNGLADLYTGTLRVVGGPVDKYGVNGLFFGDPLIRAQAEKLVIRLTRFQTELGFGMTSDTKWFVENYFSIVYGQQLYKNRAGQTWNQRLVRLERAAKSHILKAMKHSKAPEATYTLLMRRTFIGYTHNGKAVALPNQFGFPKEYLLSLSDRKDHGFLEDLFKRRLNIANILCGGN